MLTNAEIYEDHIKEIRRLRSLIWITSKQIRSDELEESKKQELIALNKKYYCDINTLGTSSAFQARNFDVYECAIEIALKKFMDEHPEPPVQEICQHIEKNLCKRLYKDNSLHTVEQCLICGAMTKSVKTTAELPIEEMAFFDQSLQDRWLSINRQNELWWSQRNQVIKEARFAGGDTPPIFDHNAFHDTYELENPRPLTQETCAHEVTEVRYRKYEASDGVVIQCTQCGKHLKNVKKLDFPQYLALPKFDELLSENLRVKFSEWAKAREEEYGQATERFTRERWIKYFAGDLLINDNSKFATYYNSPEWSNTRLRIFTRDKYRCRNISCRKTAECVHHISYDRFGSEHDNDLISLCNTCHNRVHIIQNGIPYRYKLTPREIECLETTIENLNTQTISGEKTPTDVHL